MAHLPLNRSSALLATSGQHRRAAFGLACVAFVAIASRLDANGPDKLPPPPEADAGRVALGELLFFDPRLSGDATISCATCHDPAHCWTDGLPLSTGYPGTRYFRNTPTIANAALGKSFYWDARLSGDDLPSLIRDHISESHFMQADGRLVIERMRQIPEYVTRFRHAFGGEPTYGRILQAVATFVRSTQSSDVPLDRFLAGDRSAIGPSAQRGLDLFHGKAKCVVCHNGPLLSDGKRHALGVPRNPEISADPLRQITYRRFLRTLGMAAPNGTFDDLGHQCVSKDDRDKSRFRTPSLREVASTAPYMHNGMFGTLQEVVAFYNRGGDPTSERTALHLSDGEQADLVAFLKTLSGTPPSTKRPVLPEYQTEPIDLVPHTDAHTPEAGTADRPTPLPPLAPLGDVPVPGDNPQSDAKIALGKKLFFDDRLSGDVGTSCASCHDPRIGWGDGNALSRGYAGTQHWRNSQTTVNAAYLDKLFWAGEVTSLEAQAKSAIQGNLAGNGDPSMIESRLEQIPGYVRDFKAVFGVRRPTYELAVKAIAAYERGEMVSTDSDFDAFLRGDDDALTDGALRGLDLFRGKANCIRCHNGALTTDQRYHNLGVPENPLFQNDPLRQISLRYQHFVRGVPETVYRSASRDLGLYYTTKVDADRGKFRTAPLRYLLYTAPYMHNGLFETLEEVVDFYDQGGGDDPNKSRLLEPLDLTDDEKLDLVELLESMSGEEIWAQAPTLPEYRPGDASEDESAEDKRARDQPSAAPS